MPRAGLDTERVVAAAAELVDAGGFDALSLTRLAERLGVRTPSLYAHVGGLDELRARLGTRATVAIAQALEQAAAGRAGGDALRAIADAYRAFATAHPGTYVALQRVDAAGDAPERLAAAERVVAVLLAVLRGYGLTGEPALHAVRAVRSALHGFVLLELGGGFGIPLDLDDSFTQLVTTLDRGLSAR